MMDPTSNPVNTSTTTEQPQLPNNRSAQPPPPPYTSLTLQQQQNLALQWLEQQQQQQQEHQQRQSLNQAILVAAAAQQQDQPQLQPQNMLLNSIGSAISPLTTSSTTDVRNHQQYLLEIELRRQILLQQQRLLQTNNNIPLQLDNSKSLLQDRLRQLFSTNQESTSSAVPATTSGSSINVATSDVDRIMAAETLLQRNRLQEAIRMLQIQGVLQEDNALRRTVNNNRDSNVFATSSLLLSNDPITPHTLGQATVTSSSMSQLLQPGILTMGQMETKVPHTNVAIGDAARSSSKRKSDGTHSTTRTKEMMSKKLKSKETRNENLSSSFPLPSMKKARRLTMTFKSFQDVWDELESIPLQKEIFIRRLYKYDCKLVD